MTGIYKITNMINGKAYIGQSTDIYRRWQEHKRNSKVRNTNLYQAFREYGIENFLFEILEECPIEQLNDREKFYINKYDTLNTGYNMSVIENQQYKINWEIARQILTTLKTTKLTGEEIAGIYKVSGCLVSQINWGRMWRFEDQEYPIRINYKNREKKIAKPKWQCPLSREQLKEAIRTKPFTQIGKENGVTDNAIRKWCDKYNLPRHKREIEKYTDEEWLLI